MDKKNAPATEKQIRFLKHLTFKHGLKLINEESLLLSEAMKLIPYLMDEEGVIKTPPCFLKYVVAGRNKKL